MVLGISDAKTTFSLLYLKKATQHNKVILSDCIAQPNKVILSDRACGLCSKAQQSYTFGPFITIEQRSAFQILAKPSKSLLADCKSTLQQRHVCVLFSMMHPKGLLSRLKDNPTEACLRTV